VLAIGAFCLLAALSAVASLAAGRNLQLVLYQGTPLMFYPLAALCLAWNLELRADRSTVVRYVALACALAVILGVSRAALAQFAATSQDVPRYIRGDSGSFIAATLVAVMLATRKRLADEVITFAAAAMLIVGALLSEHRSVWLAAALAFALTWLLTPRGRPITRAFVLTGLLAFLLAAGGLILGIDAFSETLDRVLSTADATSVNADYRLAAWDASIDDISDNPLTGLGFGNLFVFYNRGLMYVGAPHNSLINIAWYLGIPGFVLFSVIQGVFAVRSFLSRNTLSRLGWNHSVIFGAWLSLLIVAAFNVILESPVGAIPFWLAIGLPFARADDAK
jgi:O-antigen ligase